MVFKTVLSVIDVGQSDRDLDLAIELCGQIDAHLSVLVLSVAFPPPASEYAAALSETWLQERQEDIEKLRARVSEVTSLLAKTGLSADADGEYVERAWTDDIVGRKARYADLTLVGPQLAASSDRKTQVLNGALFESERPVLIVPEEAGATLRPKKVLVAWNSRLEAARAVRDALPLLTGAEDVCITMVDPREGDYESGPEPGADIAAYLARHGVKVRVDRLPGSDRSVADALRIHAVDMAAEMIVMGAYGHSRLRERIFGGVTRSMIDEPPLPVFMAR
ncbi:universal stress protein [Chelativorans xinjiangense]|uniref:universal stress protein n=1 Tax=Chelativorans xinjiangense TaxID=2681485 RepID=UPI0013588E51|nr:universal stress protein [Chelativorans xinjiangense]